MELRRRVCNPACREGPHRWHPLPGQVLTPRTPRELDVFDTVGEQSGEQSWVGCLHCMADINQRHWPESPYEAHACLDCRKNTPVQGEDFLTQAAAADGCTSTRYFKVWLSLHTSTWPPWCQIMPPRTAPQLSFVCRCTYDKT